MQAGMPLFGTMYRVAGEPETLKKAVRAIHREKCRQNVELRVHWHLGRHQAVVVTGEEDLLFYERYRKVLRAWETLSNRLMKKLSTAEGNPFRQQMRARDQMGRFLADAAESSRPLGKRELADFERIAQDYSRFDIRENLDALQPPIFNEFERRMVPDPRPARHVIEQIRAGQFDIASGLRKDQEPAGPHR